MSDNRKTLTKDNIKISVVIPCYNEVDTLENVIERVRECGLATEIIVVDDGSTDGSRDLMKGELYDKIDKILFHKKNLSAFFAFFSPLGRNYLCDFMM